MTLSPELLSILICPRCGMALTEIPRGLWCAQNHIWPVVDGIPVLMLDRKENTARGLRTETTADASLALAREPGPDPFTGEGVHPQVQGIIASTGGFMYAGLTLATYPIPEIRVPPGEGRTLLDVGCNWGRWTVAAAEAGYHAIGIDPNLRSLRAARHVAQSRGVQATFVCGDARVMPFRAGAFDRVFSYSVVQHFSKEEARVLITEMARVLTPGGEMMVQMPNRAGIRSLYHLARRGFRPGKAFDVRYYSTKELASLFRSVVGRSTLKVDGYFGLGIQPTDLPLMPRRRRIVIHASELLRHLARRHVWLAGFADSLYVTSRKPIAIEQPTALEQHA